MKKRSVLICLGVLLCSLCACGKEKASEGNEVVSEVTTSAVETDEEAVETEVEEVVVDYTENATQVLLDQKTSYSDIGEFFEVELYYPNNENLNVEIPKEHYVEFTCEEEDYKVEIRSLEDSTFLNNWEADKSEESYTELDLNGFDAYYTAKTRGYSDVVNLFVHLEAVTETSSRYLKIEISDTYEGEHTSGLDLYQNNTTIQHILGSISYIGNIEKTTNQDGILLLEGRAYDISLKDPSTYLATDNANMTWECQVKDSYIRVSAKDSADESVFCSSSISRCSQKTLEEWKENILKFSPDRVIESRTIGAFETMAYASTEDDDEIDCTYAVLIDEIVLNFNTYASNREMAEEYIEAILNNMEIIKK